MGGFQHICTDTLRFYTTRANMRSTRRFSSSMALVAFAAIAVVMMVAVSVSARLGGPQDGADAPSALANSIREKLRNLDIMGQNASPQVRRLLQDDKEDGEEADEEEDDGEEEEEDNGEEAEEAEEEEADEEPEEEEGDEEPAEEEFADEMGEGDAEMVPAAKCPIDLEGENSDGEIMSEYLSTLVDPCTTTEETATDPELTKVFCAECVRPIQTFLAREFHLADLMRGDDEEWDPSNTTVHEQCAMDACMYLEKNGMPYESNFHNAVLQCENFADDPECSIPTEELLKIEGVAAAIEGCQKEKDSIVMPMGEEGAEADAMIAEPHPFCGSCYWPFFESIVKATMSEDFMCRVKKEGSAMDGKELEKEILEDAHMFACLLNVEGHLRENDMQSASIGYTDMEAICFNDLNHPSKNATTPVIMQWMGEDEMTEKLEALECPEE